MKNINIVFGSEEYYVYDGNRIITNATLYRLKVINFIYFLLKKKKYFKFKKDFVLYKKDGFLAKYSRLPIFKRDNMLMCLLDLFKVKYEKCFYETNTDVVLYDSIFPARCSDFRCLEYTEYFKHFESISCLTSKEDMYFLNFSSRDCDNSIKEFNKNAGKEVVFDCTKKPFIIKNGKILYTNFLRQIYEIIDIVEIPFVFCMYPGGGFALDDKHTDKMCKKVFSNKYFRKVIVTTKITKDYLIYKGFCLEENIILIPGGVTSAKSLSSNTIENKKFYGEGKKTFDIAFFARRQSMFGEDKGYDTFIRIASTLIKRYPYVRAHIAGFGWREDTYPINKELRQNFIFYDWLSPESIAVFFKQIDVIISPNKAFVLEDKKYFDGFPTGCVVEAMLHGTVAIVSDMLNINQSEGRYTNHTDIEIIDPFDIEGYIDACERFMQNPKLLRSVATKGMNKTRKINSYKAQIIPRIKLIEAIMEKKE